MRLMENHIFPKSHHPQIYQNNSNFMYGSLCSLKKGQKMMKKATLVKNVVFKKKFVLANLKYVIYQ